MDGHCFSALQRAEIAEIVHPPRIRRPDDRVSVLFNEPKLLKSYLAIIRSTSSRRFSALQRAEIAEINSDAIGASERRRFSALQRAEIAEILEKGVQHNAACVFQCSSTSRNC